MAVPSGLWLRTRCIALIVSFWDGAGVDTSSSLAAPVWFRAQVMKIKAFGREKDRCGGVILSDAITQSRIKLCILRNSPAMVVTNDWRRPNGVCSPYVHGI